MLWLVLVARLAPLRHGGAVEHDHVEVGVQQQDAVGGDGRHIQQHRLGRACGGGGVGGWAVLRRVDVGVWPAGSEVASKQAGARRREGCTPAERCAAPRQARTQLREAQAAACRAVAPPGERGPCAHALALPRPSPLAVEGVSEEGRLDHEHRVAHRLPVQLDARVGRLVRRVAKHLDVGRAWVQEVRALACLMRWLRSA